MTKLYAAAICFLILAAKPVAAQTVHCTSVPQMQKHSLALNLLLARDDLRTIFENNPNQTSTPVQTTVLNYVCAEVWVSAQAGYAANYTQAQFDTFFKQLRAAIGNLSPNATLYGGPGQCPQGIELADLLK